MTEPEQDQPVDPAAPPVYEEPDAQPEYEANDPDEPETDEPAEPTPEPA
jgi:hypothetical protein